MAHFRFLTLPTCENTCFTLQFVEGDSLQISEVQYSDAGMYKCIARNLYGEDVWITSVHVMGMIGLVHQCKVMKMYPLTNQNTNLFLQCAFFFGQSLKEKICSRQKFKSSVFFS